jgi:hypothetical protein
MAEEKAYTKLAKNPITLGVLIGFLSALTQALVYSAGGPPAYGFCVACHTRDLVNDVVNTIFGTNLTVAPISAASITASLTMVGVIIGAFVSSKINKEFKIKKSKPVEYLFYTLGGIIVMIFGLLVGACPYRLALRTGYGDLVALIAILAMAAGVFVGVLIVQMKMKKEMA